MSQNPNVLAFVLAGGQGERLYPLTRDRAKPAVPFGGIYRIIDFTLSNCLNSNCRNIFVLTQYKSISLGRHIHMGWSIFNYDLNEYIQVIPAQQRISKDWYRGTADAIYQNLYSIEKVKPEHVLILGGDHIYKMDYQKMIQFHKEKNADVTLTSLEIECEAAAGQFGVLSVDRDARILDFNEKPEHPVPVPGKPDRCLASMGIYVFNTRVLEEILHQSAKHENYHDFGKHIIPHMIKNGNRVYAYTFQDENNNPGKTYWKDVGSIDSYWEANMDLVSVTPDFNLYDEHWPIRTHHDQAPPAKFVFSETTQGGRLGIGINSIISGGCIISGGKVERSVLSPGVRVHSYSHVYESILMEGCEIGRRARVRKAIIDKNVSIPPDTVIGYDIEEDRKRFFVSESGIVVIPKETKL